MRVSIQREGYNERRYGTPWIGVVTAWPVGKQPEMRWGNWVGSQGSAGVLEIEAQRHDIVRWGQKDKRGPRHETRWGVVLDDGSVREMKNSAEARELWRQVRGPRGGRKRGVELDSAMAPKVVELPAKVIEHVQRLTEANQTMMQEVFRLRAALVDEGHAGDCALVMGTGPCACPASTGAGIITPEELATRYGRMREQYTRALAREQHVRNILRVPEGEDTVEFCQGLIASVVEMYAAASEAAEIGQVRQAQAGGEEVAGAN